jgi:zinc transporter 1
MESIEHIIEPHELKEPMNVLIVGIIGLLVNVIGIFLFHGKT